MATGQQAGSDSGILEEEGVVARVVRHGCGTTLYHGAWRMAASRGRVDFVPEADSAAFRIIDGRVVARPRSNAPWCRVQRDAGLLFPELMGRDVFEARFRSKSGEDGVFEPTRDGDRAILTRVELKRGEGSRPRLVRLWWADGSVEAREYSDWLNTSPVEIRELPTASDVAWPVERTWGSRLERALLAVEGRLGDLEDLSGKFIREKRSLLLSRPATATGTFVFVPGRLLWTDESPRASEVLITREGMEIYDPANLRLERFAFGDHTLGRYVFLGFGDSLVEGLRALDPVVFKADDRELHLEFVPLRGPLKRHVDRISFLFDVETGMLRQLCYSDPSGDSVTTRLESISKNGGIQPKDVCIRPEPGTKIVENAGGLPWR